VTARATGARATLIGGPGVDEEVFGLDDELPEWAEQDQHGVPDEPSDSDMGEDEDANGDGEDDE
jgi:hypothetical protein